MILERLNEAWLYQEEGKMKEYHSFIEGVKKDANRVEPVLNHLRQIIYNYPPNKYPEPIPSSFQVTNKPYLSGIEWFFLWGGRPIVISVFQADPEWVVDHISFEPDDEGKILSQTWPNGFKEWLICTRPGGRSCE